MVLFFRPEQYKILEITPEVEDNSKETDADKDDEIAGKLIDDTFTLVNYLFITELFRPLQFYSYLY